jgi:hyaluronoglucosaminidase
VQPALGMIEGFYGKPWSWEARVETIVFLEPYGYRFYFYAPKADPFLRERWQEDHPRQAAEQLRLLAAKCRDIGVRFGVGLSPFEAYRDFGPTAKNALTRKLSFFAGIGVDDLAILFDDMKGDVSELAARQVEILHWIAGRATAKNLVVCPTYYSDDTLLDRFFGSRPANYLEEFGARLDPKIDIFWTGEEVCSRAFSPSHLERVAGVLRRRPFLWDNYPVNDGKRMSQYLHLRAFTGRPAVIAPCIAAHAINPAMQPVLTRIPALSLAESYAKGDGCEYGRAFGNAASIVAGPELARLIQQDISLFQDSGRDRLDAAADPLRARYRGFDHPAAREIIAWLDGAYRFDGEPIAS